MINTQNYAQLQDERLRYVKPMFDLMSSKFKFPLLMVLLHIPLGLVLYSSSALALLHPWIVVFVGLYFAVHKQEKLIRVAYVVAYLVAVEVLWRMAGSPIFWEFGKYGAAAIMIVALLRRGHLKLPTLPVIYFVCLIPASILTFMINDFSESRDKLSFNMSGPFLLFISCCFFSHLKVNQSQLKSFLITIAIPLVSVAVTTLFFTVTIENIKFTTESNELTSGGFGPNQVSSMLGLGVFACLSCYLLFKNNLKDIIYLSILCVLFTAQSVMTFSRGGIYNAVGATLFIVVLQMKNLTQGIKRLLPIAVIGLIFLLLVFPYLDDFTGGKLKERFQQTETTNRTEIIESDLQLFMENPILGAGVGEAKEARKEFLDFRAASHTEFSRLTSEHGLFGVFAIFALAFGTIYNYRRHNSIIGKAIAVGAVVWAALFMMNAGMRLAAPAILWGISFLTIANSPPRRIRKIMRRPKLADKFFSKKKLR